MPTSHMSIQDTPVALPPGAAVSLNFDVPGVSLFTRPFLSYRVDPIGVPVDLQIDLNGTVIVNENFNTNVKRSLDEIFNGSLLLAVGNVLTVSNPGAVGSLNISDIIVSYPTV